MNDKSAWYRTSLPNNQSVRRSVSAFSEHCSHRSIFKQASLCYLQEAWTQQVAKVKDVSDVSSCSCAFYLHRSKRQDLSTSAWLCTGQLKSQLSNGQCSKTDHLLTIVQLFMDGAYVSPCIRYDGPNMTLPEIAT